ncbi:hypothetical protein MRB53_039297 [Persea americana]|nr:hypothetical protein MRB53_039297 [Persea americana]
MQTPHTSGNFRSIPDNNTSISTLPASGKVSKRTSSTYQSSAELNSGIDASDWGFRTIFCGANNICSPPLCPATRII